MIDIVMLFNAESWNFWCQCNSTIVYQSHVARKMDVSCMWIRDFVVGMGAKSGGASVATGLARERGEKRAGQLAVCGCAPVHPLLFPFSLSLSLTVRISYIFCSLSSPTRLHTRILLLQITDTSFLRITIVSLKWIPRFLHLVHDFNLLIRQKNLSLFWS